MLIVYLLFHTIITVIFSNEFNIKMYVERSKVKYSVKHKEVNAFQQKSGTTEF